MIPALEGVVIVCPGCGVAEEIEVYETNAGALFHRVWCSPRCWFKNFPVR